MTDAAIVDPPAVGSRWTTRDSFIAAAKAYAQSAGFTVRLDRVKAPGASSPNSRAGLSIVCRTGNCGASFRVLQEHFGEGDWIVTQQHLVHNHDGEPKANKRTRTAQLVAQHQPSLAPPAARLDSEAVHRERERHREVRERAQRAQSEASSAAEQRSPYRVGSSWSSPNALESALRATGQDAQPVWQVKDVGRVVAGYYTPTSHASVRYRCVGSPDADRHGEGSCSFQLNVQQDELGSGSWSITRAVLGHSHSENVPLRVSSPAHRASSELDIRRVPSLSPSRPSSRRNSTESLESMHEDDVPPELAPSADIKPLVLDAMHVDIEEPMAPFDLPTATPKSVPTTPTPLQTARQPIARTPSFSFNFA